MLCPHCQHQLAELWQPTFRATDFEGKKLEQPLTDLRGFVDDEKVANFEIQWMRCYNEECRRLIVRCTQWGPETDSLENEIPTRWLVFPHRPPPRPIDQLVPERYTADYREAALILEDSPKASAALSRKVLADVLEEEGRYLQRGLSKRVDAFIDDVSNPRSLREDLHYLREIANFAVHTQKDLESGAVIDVEPDEAEWTLDVLDRLFDHYIVQRQRSVEMRAGFDEKIERAGRDPIKPLDDDPGTSE